MGLISLLFSDPIAFFVLAILLLYSLTAHEVAHGWVAYLFGDDTAKRSGRWSLNPLMHLDPVGALMILIVGFGWAKPVPVDFRNLKNFRLGLIFVSLAGCATNILIATAAIFLLSFKAVAPNSTAEYVIVHLARVNIILGSFNLIPIPPLDGSKILMGLLPRKGQLSMARLEPYGFPVLIFLLFTGILDPVIIFVQRFIFLLIGLMLGF